MSRFFVKDKYTYEKVLQKDYSYCPGKESYSHNYVNGRFMYSNGGEIARIASVSADIPYRAECSADFSAATGFYCEYGFSGEEGTPVSVTFFNGDKSFQTVFLASNEGSKLYFDTAYMDFVATELLVEVKNGVLKDITLKYCYVLDTLGEFSGQAYYYGVDGGDVCDKNGALLWTLNGKSELESPEFPDTSRTVYNMLMPRRNTVFAVIANRSDAETIKLYYTTTKHTEYSEDGCVELKLAGDAPKAYYFNLSATKNCEGRLRSFKFIAEGGGEIEILRYTFEQEKKIETLAGHIVSCIATDGEKSHITVRGTLTDDAVKEYDGGKVKVYAALMSDDVDTPDGRKLLGECAVAESFNISDVPFSDGVISYLPYQFLAFVEKDGKWQKVDDRFYVENYEDFCANPYPFVLPGYEVNVLNCGAVGDGFTDDTDAIQKAINLASSMGGGRVTVPGDDSFYGRRYIVTNLLLRTGVELHIEKGAVLWQSQLKRNYCYEVSYGHDGEIPGINWTHCLHVCNLPIIQAHHVRHIKVTGFGKIRSMDTGSEEGVDMPGYSTGCPDRIHQITFGLFEVSYVELRDFEIVRSNNYHCSSTGSDHLYFANVKMHEVKCVSGDGFGGFGVKDICINRCFFQSNDDAVTLCTCYRDPRGLLWWTSRMGEDGSAERYKIINNYLNSGGGKAIAFIPWGSSDPIQERQQTNDIEVHGNYLVCVNPVGTWPDNPYAGAQPFDNTETDDYSPLCRIRITGNRYIGNCTLGPIHATDVVTDCGIHSWKDFRNGDFTLGGFANWNIKRNSHPESAETVIFADKEKGMLRELGEGNVSAVQGLYLQPGKHTFKLDAMTAQSGAYMYVEDYDGNLLAEKKIVASPRFAECALDFELDCAKDLYIGVKTAAIADGFIIFDNCRIESQVDFEAIERGQKEKFLNNLAERFMLTDKMSAICENQKVYLTVDASEEDGLLETIGDCTDFEYSASVRRDMTYSDDFGIGFVFGVGEGRNSFYILRSHGKEQELRLTYVEDGKPEVIYRRTNFFFTSLDFHMFGIAVQGDNLIISIDGSMYGSAKLAHPHNGKAALYIGKLAASVTDIAYSK